MIATRAAHHGPMSRLATAIRAQLRRSLRGAPLLGLALCGGHAAAATFTVTNLDDAGAGSLRQAVADANASLGADVIDFQAGLSGTITLTSGELLVGEELTITGLGRGITTISGNNSSRILRFLPSSPGEALNLAHLDLTDGNALVDGGGAIESEDGVVSLDDVGVHNSSSSNIGGGISAIGNTGSLRLVDSEISGNTASNAGGGLFAYLPEVSIRSSTIRGNSAGHGGGLYVYRVSQPVTVENSTFAGNQATLGVGGGAVLGYTAGGGDLDHVTVAGNTAADVGGGLYFGNSNILGKSRPKGAAVGMSVHNSLIADNGGDDINGDGFTASDPDFGYSLVEAAAPGYSFVDNGNNLFATDPQLGTLQDNGGPTPTMLPAATSAAVDAADPSYSGSPISDQRGLDRVAGAARDIGAVEFTPGELNLSPATRGVTEGSDSTAAFTVTRSGGSDGAISVDYATADGSAVAPGDYTAASGTLNWASGVEGGQSVDVVVVDDALVEADETYSVAISNPQGGVALGNATEQTVTIASDDVFVPQPGTLAFDPATYTVAEDGASVDLTVTRSGGSDGAVSVQCDSVENASATAGSDFTTTSVTLNWADGDAASKTCSIPLLGDNVDEPDETFGAMLGNASGGAALGAAAASITLLDNDAAPQPGTLAFDPASYTVAEDGGSVDLTVTRSGGSDGAVSVQCDSVENGSATAGSDFTTTSVTLNWADGDATPRTCSIALLDDSLDEPDETFGATLGNAGGGAVLGTAAADVTVLDEDVAGSLQLGASSYTLAEGPGGIGKSVLVVTAMRVGGSDGAVSVDYATSDGSATQPDDYLPASGTLNWADGDSSSKSITLVVNEDDLVEAAETFGLALANPQGGATLGAPASAVVTIPANGAIAIAPQVVPATDLRSLALLLGGFSLLGAWALRRRG